MLGVVVSSGSFFKVTYAPFLTTRLLQQKVCIFNFEGCSKFLDIVSTGESLRTFFFAPRDIVIYNVRRLYNAEALP